jgi:hypothetical protein
MLKILSSNIHLLFKKSTYMPLFAITGINLTGFIDNVYVVEKFLFTTAISILTLYKIYLEIKKAKKHVSE